MAISDAAHKNHDELFPGHVSTLKDTDPELVEYFGNFRRLRLWARTEGGTSSQAWSRACWESVAEAAQLAIRLRASWSAEPVRAL
jgi:hypothetical protein